MMSYKPTFVANGLDEHYVWSGSTIVGKVNWRDDWGTFVFCPFNNTFFGPVFLSDLVTKLIELEAKKRKSEGIIFIYHLGNIGLFIALLCYLRLL